MNPDEHKARFWDQAREALREAQSELMPFDPEIVRRYAGQWVVLHKGHVVAHGRDGSELAKVAAADEYPNSLIVYVPTLEQQSGVWILGIPAWQMSVA